MSFLRKMKAFFGVYTKEDSGIMDDSKSKFYQFALNFKKTSKDITGHGFELIESNPVSGIKGFKDEVTFGRKMLQRIYDGKKKGKFDLYLRSILNRIFNKFAGHTVIAVFKNTGVNNRDV